jgi:two-component system CheB/CheR fusion protein
MEQAGVETFDDYHDFLEVHPGEFAALFDTILINVTSFFRDEDAWAYLAEVALPQLFEVVGDAPVRVWSAGCATGQEAYSLAMVLLEALGPAAFRQRVKIYATDVDEAGLAIARQAAYQEKELRSLPAGYLERYFQPSDGRYAFRKDFRRNIIFGRNDMVQDAPISRIDLLACRNALMYFNAETQDSIVSRLGFALRPDGVLFLGKAEMLVNHTTVFEAIDLKRRFFRKAAGNGDPRRSASPPPRLAHRAPQADDDLAALRTDAFLTSPGAQLVVDAHEKLAMINHRAGALFAMSEGDIGRPFRDLEVSFRPAELRSQLAVARDTRTTVWLRDVEWHRSANERLVVDIQLVPLADTRSRLLGTAILFNVTRFRQLQDEVESANRQLEAAYEELQSTNEQLRTRTTEISALNHFMESILGSLAAAVVVVSRDMIVQVWNKQAEELWAFESSRR